MKTLASRLVEEWDLTVYFLDMKKPFDIKIKLRNKRNCGLHVNE